MEQLQQACDKYNAAVSAMNSAISAASSILALHRGNCSPAKWRYLRRHALVPSHICTLADIYDRECSRAVRLPTNYSASALIHRPQHGHHVTDGSPIVPLATITKETASICAITKRLRRALTVVTA